MIVQYLQKNDLEHYIEDEDYFKDFEEFKKALKNRVVWDIVYINSKIYQISMVWTDRNYWCSIDDNAEFAVLDKEKTIVDDDIYELSSLAYETTYFINTEEAINILKWYNWISEETTNLLLEEHKHNQYQ